MKKFMALLLAFVLLCFAGCGEENEDFQNEEKQSLILESDIESESDKSISDEYINSNDEFDNIYAEIEKEINDTVEALYADMEKLESDINTYQKFLKSADEIKEYYAKVYEKTTYLCIKAYEYSVIYAELIMESEKTNDEKYDDLDVIYDNIYDDACDEIYDAIYDDIFDDMYDLFYDGLLDDAYDNKEYSEYREWSEARSGEYNNWSDTRSDVYDVWSDTRSDIYDFYSDIRSEIWSDDIERAEKILERFKEDIEDIKNDNKETDPSSSEEEPIIENTQEESSEENKGETNLIDGMRPEFKEALDSYEEFFDEYCDFIKKYNNNPDDWELIAEYGGFLIKYTETMKKLEELDDGSMNDAETKYYIEVTNRISQKLLETSAEIG